MTALADDKPKVPKPPRLSLLLAIALELAIVVTFATERSIVGLLLCAAYAWFSATWSAFIGFLDD